VPGLPDSSAYLSTIGAAISLGNTAMGIINILCL
jgi:hypothetical protein